MSIHLVLQGKGGVGKSMISAMMAQCYIDNGLDTLCIDTDPVNATFSSFKGFKAQHINLLKNNNIEQRGLDELMQLAVDNIDKHLIIDNGASSFIPLSAYILENDAIEMLKDMGHDIYVHTVVTGGQALLDTVSGFVSIITQFSDDAKIVVWQNEYFGEVESNNTPFIDLDVFKENEKNVHSLITIPKQSDLSAGDVKLMLEKHMTFKEAATSTDFSFMEKHRLTKFRKVIFNQMEESLIKTPSDEKAETETEA